MRTIIFLCMKIYRIYNADNISEKYDICQPNEHLLRAWIKNHLDSKINWRAVELLSYL